MVKFNTFLTDIRAQIPIYREVRDRYVSTAAPPASTTVEIPRLAREGALTEVEAIAADRVESGYPRLIANNWPGVWSDGVGR